MGLCVSSIGKTSISKKSKPISLSDSESFQKPVPSSHLSIIHNPSGTDIFKKYSLGKELGRGEFGVTYQCTDIETGKTLACKSISKSNLKTETDVEDVRREVDIMRHLPKHVNIVSLKEAYEDKDCVHLVMELCEGGELFDRIVARGHYTERAAAIVMRTIIEVIKVCHEHGVMHRDLKPENFLFANETEASPLRAIDFGLSVFFRPGEHFNEIVGSPFYMAPEVLRRDYGQEVDVWSAGVILYILLCGVPPFWAETDEGIAQAIICSAIDFERDPWPKVSEDAKDLVRSMLDPNPYSRLTAQEVIDHTWLQNANTAPDISLGEIVRARIKQFSIMNKFKRRALRVVADNLPKEQVAGIKKVFHMMDTDKNGKLTFEELKDGLHMIGQPVPDPDVHLLMEAADINRNGSLNSGEFLTITVHMKKIANEEHLCKAFDFFDKNRSGFIEYDDLRETLLEDNLYPDNEQVIRDIMCDVDTDKDGQISYEEFKAMMKAGTDWKTSSRQYSRAILNTISLRLFKGASLQLQ
ncbi:hypothetical protein GIB67_008406 [Kingdonia uniflora]|uniref:non-specific serine/threonine protein kinase n=1 Tax=Kingdonia uniflora TaxID=39325 RepID=A0A7J7N568_9MAGN|nr:hypothetical protein GIB67_008406 [Kingdonia uniflora]